MDMAYFECVDMSPPNSTCQKACPYVRAKSHIWSVFFLCDDDFRGGFGWLWALPRFFTNFVAKFLLKKDMEISLIVNIAFLVAIALVLSMMLRWDLQMLQQHSFSTADYYDWLRSTDETCSTKRIVMLAVLIGSTTTYAKESWLVMALLATVTLALATFLLKQQRKQPLHFSKRMAINSFTTLLIACIFTTIVAIMSETPELKMLNSVYSVLFFATFSYVFSLIANWLVGLFTKKDAK